MKKFNKRFIYLIIGFFLIFDGIFSVFFGHSCLNYCFNNNLIGDIVRYARAILGGVLVYFNIK